MNREDEIINKKKEAMKLLRGDRKKWITMSSTIVKEHRKEQKAIKRHLENQPATVPEVADATGIPSDKVLWHLATMKKYGDIAEGEKDGSYFRYVLTKSAAEEVDE